MATAGLAGIVEEVIFLHHRTVVGPQGIQFFAVGIGGGGQRLTHNLPAVAVKQHEHRRDAGTLDIERTVTHFEGLEPVLQILYHLLFETGRHIVIAVPAGSIGVDCIAVPVGLSLQELTTLVIRNHKGRGVFAECVGACRYAQHIELHHVVGLPVLFE